MKKIPWIKRIFMSWRKLEDYFNVNAHNNSNIDILINELRSTINDLRQDKEQNLIKNNKLESNLREMEIRSENKDKEINNMNNSISQFEKNISILKTELSEKKSQKREIEEQINKKLEPLSKIEKTFFAGTGNKGKGELGEIQVKNILEKSGIPLEMWTTNLPIGNNNVEFAIKSADDGKWIPVDSKVLEAKMDQDNKIIIDKDYQSKVRQQAKEVSKYLSKRNTAGYGILVLQSDSIYMSLYDIFPNIFQEVLKDFRIHIASPSSFVQAAWSISQIVDTYDKIQNDVSIYQEIISALDSIANFANSLKKTHKDFDNAMNRHFPAIENKHAKLFKKLEKTGKIKSIKKFKDEK